MRYLRLVIAFMTLLGVAGALAAEPPGAAAPASAAAAQAPAATPAATAAASCVAAFLFPAAEGALFTSDRPSGGKASRWHFAGPQRGRHSRFRTSCACAGGCTASGNCECTSCDGCDFFSCIGCCLSGCSENCSKQIAGPAANP
jgi:hypothetical protein